MILNIFTVFDDKAKAYLPPFFLPAIPMAVRAFSDCVNDPRHAFGKHPEDYVLFHCGEFDDSTGIARWSDALNVVGRGIQYTRINSIVDSVFPVRSSNGEIVNNSDRGGAV